MATDTSARINVGTLGEDVAQALWAAMHEDDDLVAHYLDLCVIHGLTHFLEGPWSLQLTYEGQRKLLRNLEAARERLRHGEEEFADRWLAYSEPPF